MKVGRFIINILKKQNLKGIKKRRENYPPHGEFKEFINIPYIDDGNLQHTFDIYLANKENRRNICVIDIHGGAYIFGEHQDNYPISYFFLKNGFDVINVDYQPNDGKRDTKDLTDDIAKCLNYAFTHLKDYGLENDRFVITGDSAGGHFCLMFTEALLDEEYAKELGYKFPKIDLVCALANCPVYNFVDIGPGGMTRSGQKRMFGPHYNDKNALALLSPKVHIKSLTCPLFISTCKNDFLRLQTLELDADLKRLGGYTYELMDIDSDDPKVGHVHNIIDLELPESQKVNEAMVKFVEKHL